MNKRQDPTANGFSVDAHSEGTGPTRQLYLLFAGAAPLGGLADLVGTFTSEEAARAAFKVVRLQTASSRLGWAQLAVVDGQDGLKPLCWFGIGAAPAPARQAITAHPHRGRTMQTKTVEHQSLGHPDTRAPGLRRLSKKVAALLGSLLVTGAVPTNMGMMRRVRKATVALGVALMLGATSAPWAGADHLEANDATQACREADEQGVLEAIGVTRGECVNSLKTPGNENAKSRIAALCGQEFAQQLTGTTNKGQCIQALPALLMA